MLKPWQTLSRRYLIERWWMRLRVDHVRLPNGVELEEYHVIEYPDWATVVCLTAEGEVVLVEQYRYGINRKSLELPAGAVHPSDSPLETARRELLEETGYASDDWYFLGRLAQDPSREAHYAHLYVALGARHVQPAEPEESEEIVVHRVSPAEVLRLAESGVVVHGVHVAALFWAERAGFLRA